MWKAALQLLVVLFLRNRMHKVTSGFGEQLSDVKEHVAIMAESRASIFKENFHRDIQRMANSLLGYLFMLLAASCSALIGLMWLFAAAWNSPHRDLILGTTMTLPLLLGVGVFVYIRRSWKKEPLFNDSINQIEADWHAFRNGLDGTADTSDEANQ